MSINRRSGGKYEITGAEFNYQRRKGQGYILQITASNSSGTPDLTTLKKYVCS